MLSEAGRSGPLAESLQGREPSEQLIMSDSRVGALTDERVEHRRGYLRVMFPKCVCELIQAECDKTGNAARDLLPQTPVVRNDDRGLADDCGCDDVLIFDIDCGWRLGGIGVDEMVGQNVSHRVHSICDRGTVEFRKVLAERALHLTEHSL